MREWNHRTASPVLQRESSDVMSPRSTRTRPVNSWYWAGRDEARWDEDDQLRIQVETVLVGTWRGRRQKLQTVGPQGSCEFDSHLRHHPNSAQPRPTIAVMATPRSSGTGGSGEG